MTIKIRLKFYLEINSNNWFSKVKEKFKKSRNVEDRDDFQKYVLRGEGNAKNHDGILCKPKEKQQK